MQVKILNRNSTVLDVDEAAQRLTGFGLRFAGIQMALQPPFEIEFPFSAGVRSKDGAAVLEVRGSYLALSALERRMKICLK